MPIPVVCPDCAKRLKAPDKAAGKALKCPSCGGRVPVPAEGAEAPEAAAHPVRKKKRRREPVAAGKQGSGEFIAGLDLSRAEDHETEVCPRCGTIIPEEEDVAPPDECPNCGADLLTGGKGRTALRKAKFKDRGEDPRVYYSKAAGDAWSFLMKNVDVAIRLSVLALIASVVACGSWLAVASCTFLPPKLFWGLPAVVGTLMIPGSLWVLQQAVTELAFTNKQKFKRFRFDGLDCVAKAPRIVVWAAVVLWPLTILDLLVAALCLVLELHWGLLGAALGLHAVATFLFWPAGLGHMAMPVSGPGWNFLKVAAGTARNVGPVLFWAALTIAAFLPFLGLLGGTAALTGSRVAEALATMDSNAETYRAAAIEADEGNYDEIRLPEGAMAEIDWMAFLLPGVALIPLAFLFGFAAVYSARPAGLLAKMFRPSLGLITIEKEKKYVPKLKRKSELDELEEEPEGFTWGKVGAIVGVTALLGLIGGFSVYMLGDNVPVLGAFGMGLSLVCGLSALAAGITQIVMAFQEDWRWGVGHLIPIVNGFVSLFFLVLYWTRMKYVFVWCVGLILLEILALVFQIVSGYGVVNQAS